jgi:tetratricopeptide (TPR) repeat protein
MLPLAATAQAGGGDAAAELASSGQRALAAGRYAEARDDFEKLAKLEPGIAEVHATLGVIYFKLRAYDSAEREIRTAQKLKPTLPKLDSLLGMSLAEQGKFHDALPGLERGFKQSTDAEVKRMCGLQLLRTYTGLGRDADAVTTGLALNKLYPQDPEILYQTGRIYGNYTFITMQRLHDDAPDSIWMLQAQGEAYESQKDYDGAIAAFQRVLNVDPHRPGIHYRMGRVYLRRFEASHEAKDREAAQEQFRAELNGDPGNGNAAYELAQIEYDLGNLEQAGQGFASVVTRHSEFEQAYVGLGGVLLESQKAADAIAPLKRAIELDPNDEVAWYRLARALRQSGQSGDAEKKAMAEFQRLHAISNSKVAKTGILSEAGDVTPQQIDNKTQP